MLFVASPNNPSGLVTPLAAIERLLRLPLLVVVDEAYLEFASVRPEGNASQLVGQHPNLAVLRTFSKWAGLAGLRVGYGLLPEELAGHLWKIKQPYNISVAGQAAALASLEDVGYLRGNVAQIVAERGRVYAALAELPGLQPYPSDANFILCRVTGGDALELKRALERQGILVRHYRKPGLRDCIRLSIGTPRQNDALLGALGDALGSRQGH